MRWQKTLSAAAAAGIAASGAEAFALRRRVRELPIGGLPRDLEGLTILHVSDVHAGYGPGLGLLRRCVEWSRELEAQMRQGSMSVRLLHTEQRTIRSFTSRIAVIKRSSSISGVRMM